MPSRRRFIQGMAGGLMLPGASRLLAADGNRRNELIGPEFDLSIDESPTDITGVPRRAVLVNGGIPAPTLRMRQGDDVTIRVHNKLAEQTIVFQLQLDVDDVFLTHKLAGASAMAGKTDLVIRSVLDRRRGFAPAVGGAADVVLLG